MACLRKPHLLLILLCKRTLPVGFPEKAHLQYSTVQYSTVQYSTVQAIYSYHISLSQTEMFILRPAVCFNRVEYFLLSNMQASTLPFSSTIQASSLSTSCSVSENSSYKLTFGEKSSYWLTLGEKRLYKLTRANFLIGCFAGEPTCFKLFSFQAHFLLPARAASKLLIGCPAYEHFSYWLSWLRAHSYCMNGGTHISCQLSCLQL